MSVLALRLAGPLQSWGSGSRFIRRTTEMEPTKSGVVGMVAAAQGRNRTDPIEDLLDLRFGVRIDQPGQLVRDFQTARRPKRGRNGETAWESLPLSHRYYISDAVFLAVLEGEHELLSGIGQAVRSPEFPLYLGRRSCPPAGPVLLGVSDADLDTALRETPWQASTAAQRRHRESSVRVTTVRDADQHEHTAESVHDLPVSFDPNRRQYGWRSVTRDAVELPNPHGTVEPTPEHDPLSLLGG